MDERTLANMKARVALCRRVATMTHNPEIVEIMNRIADEGEADIRRLEEAGKLDSPAPGQSLAG